MEAASGEVTAGVGLSFGHLPCRVGVGIRRAQFGAGQVGGQPPPHLRRSDREGRQRTHIAGGTAGFDDNAERHIQRCLGEDLQRRTNRQAVQSGHHGSIDRVLDRHACVVGDAVSDCVQRRGSAVQWQPPQSIRPPVRNQVGGRHLEQRRLGEGPFGTEISDAGHTPTLMARDPEQSLRHSSELS